MFSKVTGEWDAYRAVTYFHAGGPTTLTDAFFFRADIAKNHSTRQQFLQQQHENEMVSKVSHKFGMSLAERVDGDDSNANKLTLTCFCCRSWICAKMMMLFIS